MKTVYLNKPIENYSSDQDFLNQIYRKMGYYDLFSKTQDNPLYFLKDGQNYESNNSETRIIKLNSLEKERLK
jgi:AMMECR1 domain-containing protein